MGVMCLSLYTAKIAASSAYFYVYVFLQVLWNALFVNIFFKCAVKSKRKQTKIFRVSDIVYISVHNFSGLSTVLRKYIPGAFLPIQQCNLYSS